MPELPEVETIKKELEKAVLGKEITDVLVNNPKIIKEPKKEEFIRGLKGAAIKNILRKGKLLIFELSSGKSLAVHLKMTGQLIYPGDAKRSRVSFKLSDGKWLDFNDRRRPTLGRAKIPSPLTPFLFARPSVKNSFQKRFAHFQTKGAKLKI